MTDLGRRGRPPTDRRSGRVRIRTEPLPAVPAPPAATGSAAGHVQRPRAVFDIRDKSIFYGDETGPDDVTLRIHRDQVTALIGPSGCGKIDLPPQPQPDERLDPRLPDRAARSSTTATTSTAPTSNRVEVRRRIGMVFQKPNPFPKSIYDNVAWAPRNLGMRTGLDERVEQALRGAALWDEVKDRLKD